MNAQFFGSMTLCAVLLFSTGTARAEETVLETVTLEPVEDLTVQDAQAGGLPPIEPTGADGALLNISTTKIGIPASRVGNHVTVITRQEIQEMEAMSLLDVLRQVPGVEFAQSGGPGQTTSILKRGLNGEPTLIK